MKRLLIAAFVLVALLPTGPSAEQQQPPRHRPAVPRRRSRRRAGCSARGVKSSPVDAIVRDKSGRDCPRPHRRRLRDPRVRPPAAGHQLQLRGDQGQGAGDGSRRPTCWPASKRSCRSRRDRRSSAAAAPAAPPADVPTSESMAGRRLITLLFDVSSMQPDDVQRAVDSAQKYRQREDEQRRPGRRSSPSARR